MKKVCVAICFVIVFIFSGCAVKNGVMESFGEITKEYYSAASADGKMQGNISVGEREEPYVIDGKRGRLVEFSLIVLKLNFFVYENQIVVQFCSEKEQEDVAMEFNPINGTYMADLGYSIDSGGEYSIKYLSYSIDFKKESEQFKVDYNDAIEKSINYLGGQMDKYYKGGEFIGECYLKILSKPDEEFNKLYWIFSVIGRNGESNNVLIDVYNQEIVLSN